ncbi:MAG: glycoside hydrolase family 28 protein [bacterium]|nr:glycoside hydrolase family 28 protein [bacterium]
MSEQREEAAGLSLQERIDACEEGGVVRIPAGVWKSGPLHLKSHMTLRLEAGCHILFSDRFFDYLPPVFTRWEGVECYNYSPLIYARDCEDITIEGEGMLDGNGAAWWPWKKKQQQAADRLIWAQSRQIPVKDRMFGTERDALRPSFLQFLNCKNITVKDITLVNGPQWTLHPVYCKQVHISGVTIRTAGPNTDGCNPDSCEDVLIEDCCFETGDDCIAINSGLNEDGWRVNRPCKNVEIRNCRFLGGHAAIAIGSGMSGGIDEIRVHDCVIEHAERGIRVKSMRGRGGYVRNLHFEHIKMGEVEREAIQISMNYGSSTSVPASKIAPTFCDFSFEDISCNHAAVGLELVGLPESPLKKISFHNLRLIADVKEKTSDTEEINFS